MIPGAEGGEVEAPASPSFDVVAGAGTSFEAKIQKTVAHYTVSSNVGPSEVPIPIALSNFLLDHPDLSAFIVNRHKIAPYRITMRGPRESWADDGDGTQGLIDLVHRKDTERTYFGEGEHHSLLFPPIRATAVIYMRLEETLGSDCKPQTKSSFEVYVRMKNRFLSGLIATLRPFLKKTVIGKFTKAFSVADKVGRLLAQDPEKVEDDVRAFTLLSPEDRGVLFNLIGALKRVPAPCGASSEKTSPKL